MLMTRQVLLSYCLQSTFYSQIIFWVDLSRHGIDNPGIEIEYTVDGVS